VLDVVARNSLETMANRPFSSGWVAFDYETTGLRVWHGEARPFLLGLEDEEGNVLLARPGTREWGRAKMILGDKRTKKVGWNVKYDLSVSVNEGIKVEGEIHDAMLMCYMNYEYEQDLKLKGVGKRHFGREPQNEQTVRAYLSALRRKAKPEDKHKVNYSCLPKAMVEPYLEEDLDLTLMAKWKFGHVVKGPQERVYEVERELIPNVVELERWGINIDIPYCKRMLKELGPRKKALEKKMYDIAGVKFNQNSIPQLSSVLLSLGIKTGEQSANGNMPTGVEELRPFANHEFVKTLMGWRSIQKIDSTYFQPFIDNNIDGIIHPSFWPFGSEEGGIKTGRFSCTDPNFQNIPGGGRGKNVEMDRDPGLVRRAVVPRPGYVFLFADYSQIEFRIFACHVGDPGILKDLRNGVDFHTANAYRLFGKGCMDGKTKDEIKRIRFQAKELNFSFIFGMGVARCAARMGVDIMEARRLKGKFFNEVPQARDFLMKSQADLLRDGEVVDQFGRAYHVPKELCYKAANVLCQGPAAIVMKRGINRTFKNLRGMDAHPFITVHDELGVEVRRDKVWEAKNLLVEGLEDKTTFPVDILVDVTVAEKSWADKKPWKEEEHKWKPRRLVSSGR
jgi:DNA polymerase-1